MWFNKEVFERFERFEQLSRRFNLMEIAVAEELQQQRNKVALIEKKVDELKWLERRVKTLDAQVDALMNREEEWKRRLAKIETGIIVEQMKQDGVHKEIEDWTLLPRLGDIVMNLSNGNDIRKVFENHYGFVFIGKDFRTIYSRDQIKDSLKEWKVIARKEDLK